MSRLAPALAGLLAVAAGGATSVAAQDEAPPRPAGDGAALAAVADHACFACHGGLDATQRAALDERRPPRLAGPAAVAERVDGAWLAAFLADPRGTRPHTTHPHELAGLDDSARARVAADLAAFLSRDAEPDGRAYPSSSAELERGRKLFHSVGCVACHVPEELPEDLAWTLADWNVFEDEDAAGDAAATDGADAATFVPPGTLPPGEQPLPVDLAEKYSVRSLGAFLADPLAARPSGHMPDMDLGPEDARAIAAYLLREEVKADGAGFVERPGLVLTAETLEPGSNPNARRPRDLPRPIRSERSIVDGIDIAHRPDDNLFVLRYQGIVEVPEDGDYTFALRSDDGSWLDLDGERVIDNGGVHGAISKQATRSLVAGPHPISVVMFENAGGEVLELTWAGPGVESGPIPAAALSHWELDFPGLEVFDGGDAARGRAAFAAHGCANCHDDVDLGPLAAVQAGAPPACLSGAAGRTRYQLATDAFEGAAAAADGTLRVPGLVEALAARTATPRDRAEHLLERRSCLQCHRRDERGGVHPDRRAYFQGDAEAELGDEARYPPHLSGVGRKLNDGALARALAGEERARPYLLTRMPRYGVDNVGGLAELFASADRVPGEGEAPAALPPRAVNVGRRLAGVENGLGCVQCHDFLGNRSLGVRAVDLGKVHTRIRWPWFRDLLLDPGAVGMNSRMTSVFLDGVSPVQDLCGGDPGAQAAALWAFLAEEDQMAPPPGLTTGDAAYELAPLDEVRTVGVFMEGVSARVLCVGTPEGLHYAWDMETCAFVKVWRGRFMNVRGTWEGRAGQLEKPPTRDLVDLPPGPAVAVFGPEQRPALDPWPLGGARPLSRFFTEGGKGRPIFEYELAGLKVTETPLAVAEGEHQVWYRTVSVEGSPRGELRFRLARASAITPVSPGAWDVGGDTPHRVIIPRLALSDVFWGSPPPTVELVEVDGALELRATAQPLGAVGRLTFEWCIQW